MALRIVCMCGYVIQGDDDDELWINAQGHMGVLHPRVGRQRDPRGSARAGRAALAVGALQQQPSVDGLQAGVGRDPELLSEQDA